MKLFTHSGQLLPQNYFKSYRSHYLNTFTDYFQLLLYLEKKSKSIKKLAACLSSEFKGTDEVIYFLRMDEICKLSYSDFFSVI